MYQPQPLGFSRRWTMPVSESISIFPFRSKSSMASCAKRIPGALALTRPSATSSLWAPAQPCQTAR